jgi:hypothetical protein
VLLVALRTRAASRRVLLALQAVQRLSQRRLRASRAGLEPTVRPRNRPPACNAKPVPLLLPRKRCAVNRGEVSESAFVSHPQFLCALQWCWPIQQ